MQREAEEGGLTQLKSLAASGRAGQGDRGAGSFRRAIGAPAKHPKLCPAPENARRGQGVRRDTPSTTSPTRTDMTETVKPLTSAELPAAMKAFFAARYAIECEIDDLKREHIAPLNEDKKTLVTEFKARSGLTNKIVDAHYRLYKLEHEADLFDEADAEQRKLDLERAWLAVKRGNTLNFVDAMEAEQPAAQAAEESPFGDDDDFVDLGHGLSDDEEDDRPAGRRELRLVEAAPKGEPEPQPDAHEAYGAEEQAQAADDDYTDTEGEQYDKAYRFGQAGNLDISALIKLEGVNPTSPAAESMRAGHIKGFDEYTLANPPAPTEALFGADDGDEDEASAGAMTPVDGHTHQDAVA